MNTSQGRGAAMNTSQGNQGVVWIIIGVAVLANIAGYMFNLYEQFWWFDEVLHAYTIFSITLLLGLLAYGVVLTGLRTHRFLLVLMIASIGIAIGGLWEVAEWAYDQMVTGNVILGKTDTIIDLIVDSIGALVAGFLSLGMLKR